jgi:hypothetical protein
MLEHVVTQQEVRSMNGSAITFRQHYEPIEEEARSLFLEDPNRSLDEVARTLSHKYRDQGITKSAISRIRKEVRRAITSAMTPEQPPVLRGKNSEKEFKGGIEPFNPVRWHQPTHATQEVVESVMAAVHTLKSKAPKAAQRHEQQKLFPEPEPGFPESTHEERIRFLEDYALNNINATIDKARQALKHRFGVAVGTKAISETLAIAKQLANESKSKLEEALKSNLEKALGEPLGDPIVDWVKKMRAFGIRQITVEASGFNIKMVD